LGDYFAECVTESDLTGTLHSRTDCIFYCYLCNDTFESQDVSTFAYRQTDRKHLIVAAPLLHKAWQKFLSICEDTKIL